jgi:class 3 adenylate cyclase/tetratricopeptide (TPR) repeat protein
MRTCPTCGEENPDRARFCLACGTDLDAAAAAPAGAEERKVVSVLFVDLVGFTQASDAADPEDVRARLRPYHAALKREIERFGGTVEKFIGDAVMAVFGAPVAHEDDAERAVRAALRILDAIPELNEEHPGLDLAVRAAVNTGEAVVSLGARPERGEGLVAGDVVNTASRLQGAAPVGAVVVGEITHRATRDVFRYEELAPVAVKGKSEPVALWRTIEARGRYGVDVERPRTPFVGREEDLGVLQQTLLRSIRDPGVQLVTITGEPGVGKTRLVAEFQAWVDDRPELVFWRQGRCLPYGDGIAFWALGEVVKAHAGILESDGPPEAAAKLAATVDGLAEEADRDWIRTRLEPLVGLEAPGSRSTDRTESFAAWRAFLEAIAAENPLVLVLEDLHWADETMLEFVDDLVDWASGVALTVICTARPELFASHPGWGGGKRNSATLGLAPLSGEDTARLISALLDRAVLPAETQSLLMERAGGNPLYAEEFVRMLVDRGILQQHGQAWTVVADGEVPVPETVQATIAARLDALGPDHKAMLQDASVVGKVFWSGVVAAMGDRGDHDVREGLHELARKELIRPARRSSVEGQAEYAFWHALVRDVTYGQLPRPARIRKHRAAAAWIEELAGDRVADQVELLVHHEREALGLARATGATDEIRALEAPLERHLVTASERNEGLDLGKAESFAREAVELAGPEDRGAALTRLANVLFRASRHREAVDAAREAVRAFEATGQEEEAFEPMVTLPVILWQLGDTEDSAVMFHDVIERLEARPPSPVLAKAYTRWAGNAMISGDSAQTLEYAGKAIPLCERFGLVDERARALQFRGSALCEIGQQEAGVSDLRESLRICLELGLADVPVAYVNLGDWIWEHEGPSAALEQYRRGFEYGERRGLANGATWCLAETTWVLYDLGRWDELLEAADEVLRLDGGRSQVSILPVPYRIRVLTWRGRVDEAAALVPDMLERARHIRDPQILLPSLSAAAFVEDERGRTGSALDLLAEYEEAAASAPPWWPSFLSEGFRIVVRAGELERAGALVDRVGPLGVRVEGLRLSYRAALTEAEGDLEAAIGRYGEAAAHWASYGLPLEEAQALLGSGRCLLSTGRPHDASVALRDARTIVHGLGAVRLVDEADRLLAEATALSS